MHYNRESSGGQQRSSCISCDSCSMSSDWLLQLSQSNLARFVEAPLKALEISTLFQLHIFRPWNYGQNQRWKKEKKKGEVSVEARGGSGGGGLHPPWAVARASLLPPTFASPSGPAPIHWLLVQTEILSYTLQYIDQAPSPPPQSPFSSLLSNH